MTFFIIMYSITLSNLAWLILAWEDQYGVARWRRLQDKFNVFKNRQHFNKINY